MATAAHAHGHSLSHPEEEHPPPVVWSSRMPIGMMGMMFFIGSEAMLFGSFFMAYFFIRVAHLAHYSDWAHQMGESIPLKVATFNSLILFSSSVTVHWAGIALRRGARAWQSIWLAVTLILGLTFFGIQVNEYGGLLTNEKIGPSSSAFSSVFFSITGIHGSHVLVGAILLIVMLVRSIRGHYGPTLDKHSGWEAMSIYWHFVDLVWVFVFGLIYLPGNLDRWTQWPIMAGGVAVLFVLWHLPRFIGKGVPAELRH
jgi:cytochrome c oxidase subunit 3